MSIQTHSGYYYPYCWREVVECLQNGGDTPATRVILDERLAGAGYTGLRRRLAETPETPHAPPCEIPPASAQ